MRGDMTLHGYIGAATRLASVARAFPGDRLVEEIGCPSFTDTDSPDGDLAPLRARVGKLLAALAARVEEALPLQLARAQTAWDQADSLSLVDADLRAEADSIRTQAHLLGGAGPQAAAAATESLLAVEAALGLCALLERRLATLVRLRARDGGSLLPAGRPFLDVGAALADAARGWR
jgi:hypothetical protein